MGKKGKLLVSLIGTQLAGIIGSLFTAPAIPNWYASLNKPSFNPPNFIFAPVWTILFLLMGISLYLVWQKGLNTKGVKTAIYIFLTQLVLNTLWSVLFFGIKSPILAFVDIVILWVFILVMTIKFYHLHKTAGILQIPYLLWVAFASLLNLSIVSLN